VQRPANKTLAEIKAFLDANPTEVVTIFIEDYVHAPNGITRLFTNAGLMKYWMPAAMMASNGRPWLTLGEMIQRSYRLLVFTQDSSKEATEGVAFQWRYTTENQCKLHDPVKPKTQKVIFIILADFNYFGTNAQNFYNTNFGFNSTILNFFNSIYTFQGALIVCMYLLWTK
jgi:hypothetical protein